MNLSSSLIFYSFILFCVITTDDAHQHGRNKSAAIDGITDIKVFKKLLRSKTNILVCFINYPSPKTTNTVKAFKDAADTVKGHGTMVIVDCNGNAKKMCRKLKVSEDEPIYLKHYKDGEFHKDYDRKSTTPSFINFMRDPSGGIPWEEDPTAADVVHLPDPESLVRFLRKGPVFSIIMFFAPWCGHCKTLKPEYANAASDLKGEAFLAAVDVSRPENSGLIQQYNITVFPTLLFYENGKLKFPYEGENNRAALVEFMRDPQPLQKASLKSHIPKEKDWALTISDVIHLTSDSFDPMLKEEKSALVVFHAPWCGHCKRIKPEYERAASLLKDRGINGMLAAVDATKEPELASKFGVKGYPTIKYFSNGEFKFDISLREEMKIVEFMKDPQEPTPPPPPEPMWPEGESYIVHLQTNDFRSTLKKKKHALVMFYAPWCSHCKRAKPEFLKLAEVLKDDSRTIIGAVDCTENQSVCQENGVKGYPTIKYYSYYDKFRRDYNGNRLVADMVDFMKDPLSSSSSTSKSMADVTQSKYEKDVMTITDASFEKEISSSDATFVMFYAPWCTHCTKTKPAFEAASKHVEKDKLPAKLRMVDCTLNPATASAYKIASYPTFKLFRNGKMAEDYSGDRTTEEFLTFIRNFVNKNVKQEL